MADISSPVSCTPGRYVLPSSGASRCPRTIADGCSRDLLACPALPSTAGIGAHGGMVRRFQAHGLPGRIRRDTGALFAT